MSFQLTEFYAPQDPISVPQDPQNPDAEKAVVHLSADAPSFSLTACAGGKVSTAFTNAFPVSRGSLPSSQ